MMNVTVKKGIWISLCNSRLLFIKRHLPSYYV